MLMLVMKFLKRTFFTLYELHFPLSNMKLNKNVHRLNNFMTAGLLISRGVKNDLHKKALLNPVQFSDAYKEYCNIFNSTLRLSKQLYLDENFRKNSKNPIRTWDLLKETTFGAKTTRNITEILSNGSTLTNPVEIAGEFNEFFANIGQKISNSVPPTSKDPDSYLNNYDPSKRLFDIGNTGPIHVIDLIKSFDNKSSLDLDGMSLKILKHVSYEICTPLAHIFNLSLESGIFPEKMKSSRTVPVYKAGDPKLCDNYRPISLVNTFSKILEKMVSIKLTNHLQINDLLYKHQYGFLNGKSTEHNLMHVVNYISNSQNNGNFCIGVFLDLKKAFDVCSHEILIKKTKKWGLKGLPKIGLKVI